MNFKDEDEKKQYEYEKLFAYDLELTKLRWTVFTVLFTISLVIAGSVLKGDTSSLTSGAKYTIAFGFLVYLTATYHYFWHHRISHRIRERLEKIEEDENIDIITYVRQRPGDKLEKKGKKEEIKTTDHKRPVCDFFKRFFRPYFHWAVWIMGAAYAILTFLLVGPVFFLYFIGGLIISILILAVIYNIILPHKSKKGKKKNKG